MPCARRITSSSPIPTDATFTEAAALAPWERNVPHWKVDVMFKNCLYAGIMVAALLAGSAAQADPSTSGAAGTGWAQSPAPGSNTAAPTTAGAGAPNPSK